MARRVRWNNPTIKPPFGAQIDWSNPITEGLVGCWLFNEMQGNIHNLAKPEEIGYLYGDTKWTGDACYFDGDNDYIITDTLSPILPPFSVVTEIDCIKNSNSSSIIGANINNTYGWTLKYEQYSNTGKVGFTKHGKVDITSSLLSPIGKSKVSVIVDVTTVSFFVDKQKDVINDSNPIKTPSDKRIILGIFYKDGNLVNELKGKIYKIYLFSRAVSDLEIEQLYHEPYSFFLYPQYWYLVDFGGINSKEYSSIYDILNKNEYNNKYDIQTKTEKNIKYDILTQNSYISKYDILTKKETNVSYDILAKTDRNITYDILNRLTKKISYDILSAKEYNSKYDLLNSLTSSILYNILTKNEYNIIYDILGTTAIEYTIKYDILNSAQTNIIFDILSKKEATIKYDILASRTSNIVYDILAKFLTNIIYNILTKKETTFPYNIINKKEINFKYDILTTKLYTNIYNILTKSEYKILYDILSDIVIKPEVIFKLDKQDTILKVGKSNTIFVLDKSNNTRNY